MSFTNYNQEILDMNMMDEEEQPQNTQQVRIRGNRILVCITGDNKPGYRDSVIRKRGTNELTVSVFPSTKDRVNVILQNFMDSGDTDARVYVYMRPRSVDSFVCIGRGDTECVEEVHMYERTVSPIGLNKNSDLINVNTGSSRWVTISRQGSNKICDYHIGFQITLKASGKYNMSTAPYDMNLIGMVQCSGLGIDIGYAIESDMRFKWACVQHCMGISVPMPKYDGEGWYSRMNCSFIDMGMSI